MKKILLENNEFELIKEYKNGFDLDELTKKYTDYFNDYDYILGDWAYGKLRLKGFYEQNNKECKGYNNINNLKRYLKDNCAFNCKYFVIKKVYKNK